MDLGLIEGSRRLRGLPGWRPRCMIPGSLRLRGAGDVTSTSERRSAHRSLLGYASLLSCSLALASCGGGAPSPASPPSGAAQQSQAERRDAETARLNAWLDARYEEELKFSPMEQTMLGRKSDYDKIDDMSESAQDAELAWRRNTVDVLKRDFDYGSLTPDAKLSYDLWTYNYERAEAGHKFRRRAYV